MRLSPRDALSGPDDDCCRVCGRRGDLSFEHIPPASAGNEPNAWMYGFEDWLDSDEDGRWSARGRLLQKGSGVQSLCRRCNTTAGARYVPELADWTARAGRGLANGVPTIAEADATVMPYFVTTTFERVRPARFLKQVATMMLALTPPGFAPRNPDLCAFAQDPEWVGLPEEYQFYLALFCGPHARFNGGMGIVVREEADGFGSHVVLELAYPPFAYILSLDGPLQVELGISSITSFADLGIDQRADVELTMRIGFGHTPFPLDYRSRAMLERHRALDFEQRSSVFVPHRFN